MLRLCSAVFGLSPKGCTIRHRPLFLAHNPLLSSAPMLCIHSLGVTPTQALAACRPQKSEPAFAPFLQRSPRRVIPLHCHALQRSTSVSLGLSLGGSCCCRCWCCWCCFSFAFLSHCSAWLTFCIAWCSSALAACTSCSVQSPAGDCSSRWRLNAARALLRAACRCKHTGMVVQTTKTCSMTTRVHTAALTINAESSCRQAAACGVLALRPATKARRLGSSNAVRALDLAMFTTPTPMLMCVLQLYWVWVRSARVCSA